MTTSKEKSPVFLKGNFLFVAITFKYFKRFRVNLSTDICHHTATMLSDLDGFSSLSKLYLTNPCK